ncbi:MAG: hypothetical protein ACTH59_08455 [Pseudoalteromonas nigrifaciens]|uniref:hypothetical protein n=1 Tax=Pseudoalteromonas nigrifaciens TaxID=28109 RepID=UPI003F94E1D1
MQKIMFLLVPLLVAGCQSTSAPRKQTKQLENYTHLVCQVKKQNVGNFSETIIFDKDYQTMTIGDETLACTSDKYKNCVAKLETPTGYKFYTVSIYTNKYPGSGYLDMAEINNKMLVNASYAELECNRR